MSSLRSFFANDNLITGSAIPESWINNLAGLMKHIVASNKMTSIPELINPNLTSASRPENCNFPVTLPSSDYLIYVSLDYALVTREDMEAIRQSDSPVNIYEYLDMILNVRDGSWNVDVSIPRGFSGFVFYTIQWADPIKYSYILDMCRDLRYFFITDFDLFILLNSAFTIRFGHFGNNFELDKLGYVDLRQDGCYRFINYYGEELIAAYKQVDCSWTENIDTTYKLEVLDVSDNKITTPVPFYFPYFRHMTTLDLSSNFMGGTSTTWLDATYFPGIAKEGIVKWESLISLNLAFTDIVVGPLPVDYTVWPNIKYFNVSHSKFDGKFPEDWVQSQFLQVLDFSYANVSGEIEKLSWSSSGLKYLDLSGNENVFSIITALMYNMI
jgi:hypothetical protein